MNRSALKGQLLSRLMMLAAVFVATSEIFFVPDAHASFSETLTSVDVRQSFSVDWDNASKTSNGDPTSPLSAVRTFSVHSLSLTQLELGGTIDNTTSLTSGLTQGYLMYLGISSDPTATSPLATKGNTFTQVGSPGNFPGGFKNIDDCVYSANIFSGGLIYDGLAAGSTDSFVLTLAGTFWSSPSLTLSDYSVKFQTNEGSYEFGGSAFSEPPEPGNPPVLRNRPSPGYGTGLPETFCPGCGALP